MPRKKRFRPPEVPHSPNWVVEYEVRIPGRNPLTVGKEFKVKGEPGRFVFTRYVTNVVSGESWVDCAGPGREFRSIRPERVKTVHNKKKRRGVSV